MTLKDFGGASWISVAAVLMSVATVSPVVGQDWTQWRGPSRDGGVTSFNEPSAWPDTLTRRWQIEVGLGYASPLLVGDRGEHGVIRGIKPACDLGRASLLEHLDG